MNESMATRVTASRMNQMKTQLGRDALGISDELVRFASDVEKGVAGGYVTQIASSVQQLLVRAARLDAMREVGELYEAERIDGSAGK